MSCRSVRVAGKISNISAAAACASDADADALHVPHGCSVRLRSLCRLLIADSTCLVIRPPCRDRANRPGESPSMLHSAAQSCCQKGTPGKGFASASRGGFGAAQGGGCAGPL